MIGMILEAQGRLDQARKTYESIIAGGGRAPIAANNLAYQYADRSEQLDVALNPAQSAKAELPDSPEVSDTLGWVYHKKGLSSLAIAPLLQSVERNPQNAEYHYHMGLAYIGAGEVRKARPILEKAFQLDADAPLADAARKALSSAKG